MTPTRIRQLMLALLMGLLPMTAIALDEPHNLHLLGHAMLDGNGLPVVLAEADWHWLRERRTLFLGVSAPDYAPFELTNNNDELEGITADYARLLAEALNIRVEVRRYDTRDELIEALKLGAVDLLGTANGFEAGDPQLVLSRSYANDQPVLVTRTEDTQALTVDLAGKRVAMLYHYMAPDAVQAFYPPRARGAVSVYFRSHRRRGVRSRRRLSGRCHHCQLSNQPQPPEQCANGGFFPPWSPTLSPSLSPGATRGCCASSIQH